MMTAKTMWYVVTDNGYSFVPLFLFQSDISRKYCYTGT